MTSADLFGDEQELTTQERADHLFLHALLQEVYRPADLQGPIRTALVTIKNHREIIPSATAATGSRSLSSRRGMAAWITILAAVLVLGLWGLLPHESTASEILQEVIIKAEASGDREYRIELAGHPRLEGRLWVNGGDRFLLRLTPLLPLGDKYVWLGGNGTEYWFVPVIGPVVVGKKAEWLRELIQRRQSVELPLMHLSSVTRRLTTRYLPPELVGRDGRGIDTLVARQREPSADWLPERVEIRADRKTHVIEQLDLQWAAGKDLGQPFGMRFVLQGEASMPGNWYEHAAHHEADRRIINE